MVAVYGTGIWQVGFQFSTSGLLAVIQNTARASDDGPSWHKTLASFHPGFPSSGDELLVTDQTSVSPLAGRSVLVIDDVRVVRQAVFRFLSEAGARVFEAASVGEALEVLGTARPAVQLVITDVVMPEMNGVDLARVVREQWPGTNVFFMSAFPAEVLVREGLANPDVLFLAKPFTRDELMAKVSQALAVVRKRNGEESSLGRSGG
ncbi:MAG TPA: response regulator [Gemmatimonadales bacterium]|nr:response regulator [Gemmatimonadales bacterium]